MAMRILTPYFLLGQDSGFPETNFNINGPQLNENVAVRSANHTRLIREIAAAGTVLLKNERTVLPLQTPRLGTLAVIGSDAAPNLGRCMLNACLNGTLSIGWGSGTTPLDYLVAPLTAIEEYVRNHGGSLELSVSASDDMERAINAAAGAGASLVFVAANSGEGTFQIVDWNLGDRKDLFLWHYGDNLVRDGTPLVLFTCHPSPRLKQSQVFVAIR
jgi:beta-glucosidase